MDSDFLSAEEAAQLLGVSIDTLYAYVSRKSLRSQQIPGSRAHQYWKADIERIRTRATSRRPAAEEPQQESEITLISERGPYYRGRSAIELADSASLESVAALLWEVSAEEVFTSTPPRTGKNFAALDALLATESGVDRAIAHFSFLEHTNPRSFDLSPLGMARTGADVVRWLTAILLRQKQASSDPIHLQFGKALNLSDERTDLVRRLLVLSSDHGFEQSTFAVRAVASTGVTPWPAVATGLAVATGRRSKFGYSEGLRRFLTDIVSADDPEEPIIRRLREGETLPGFANPIYPLGDPRARALLDSCDRVLAKDEAYRRLKRALQLAHELQNLKPSFALAAGFTGLALGLIEAGPPTGLGPTVSVPFLVARSVGWIAHAIEQYKRGEAERKALFYRGPLPQNV